jgi:hypothetical protein
VILRGRFKNKLPIELNLTNLRLQCKPFDAFSVDSHDVYLSANDSADILLSAIPNRVGRYHAEYARWNLSDSLSVKYPLRRPGPLLHKTLKQRAHRERGDDKSLHFEVVPPHPLLNILFQGIPEDVLQGQIMRTDVILKNEGAAPAGEIYLKLSHPCFCFTVNSTPVPAHQQNSVPSATTTSSASPPTVPQLHLPMWGQSGTVVRIPSEIIVPAGDSLHLTAWVQLNTLGKQQVSILAAYKAVRQAGGLKATSGDTDSGATATVGLDVETLLSATLPDGEEGDRLEAFGPGHRCRTSFTAVDVR